MCTMYSDRWRFKYGMYHRSPFMCEPVFIYKLVRVKINNEETFFVMLSPSKIHVILFLDRLRGGA